MPYCIMCEKNVDGDLELCPDCGELLEPEAEELDMDCGGECSSCSLDCSHEEHDECDGSCDVGLWPLDDDNQPIKPALLKTVMGSQIDYEMTISLLQSFAIPTIRDYPSAIQNAKILMGFSGAGMEVYVPENMLELAKELLDSEPIPAEE